VIVRHGVGFPRVWVVLRRSGFGNGDRPGAGQRTSGRRRVRTGIRHRRTRGSDSRRKSHRSSLCSCFDQGSWRANCLQCMQAVAGNKKLWPGAAQYWVPSLVLRKWTHVDHMTRIPFAAMGGGKKAGVGSRFICGSPPAPAGAGCGGTTTGPPRPERG